MIKPILISVVKLLLLLQALVWSASTYAETLAAPVYSTPYESFQPPATNFSSSSGKAITMAVPGNMHADINKGMPTGVIAEATEQILIQMGYAPRVITMSYGDMTSSLKSGDIAVGVGLLVKNSHPQISYSDPIVREYNVLITKDNSAPELNSLDELGGLKIGARVGFKYPNLEKVRSIKLIRQRKDGENIRGLFLGELDMAVIASISDIYEFRSEGVMSSLAVTEKAVGFVDLGAGFSIRSLGKDFMSKFNNKLKVFKNSKAWETILEKNGVLDLVKDWDLVEQ